MRLNQDGLVLGLDMGGACLWRSCGWAGEGLEWRVAGMGRRWGWAGEGLKLGLCWSGEGLGWGLGWAGNGLGWLWVGLGRSLAGEKVGLGRAEMCCEWAVLGQRQGRSRVGDGPAPGGVGGQGLG